MKSIFFLLLFFIIIICFINTTFENNELKYKLIIVKNKNYILIHYFDIINKKNFIYKIYKNKFI